MTNDRTVIVTGGSQGIGPALVQAFLDRGYNVVATLRNISKADFAPSRNLMLVDGDINQAATAQKVAHTAISKFGSALITCTAKLRRAFREMTEGTGDNGTQFLSKADRQRIVEVEENAAVGNVLSYCLSSHPKRRTTLLPRFFTRKRSSIGQARSRRDEWIRQTETESS